MSEARRGILARVSEALQGRPPLPHPGAFAGWRAQGADSPPPHAEGSGGAFAAAFAAAFRAAGGEVVEFSGRARAVEWLRAFATDFESVATGTGVPQELRPDLPGAPAEHAALGVSLARGAVAETGSLVLDARDGRRVQLLPPTHLVWLPASDVHSTLADALEALAADLPSGLGLHSGPSKSADIGQIVVRGVHGPGRVIAAVLGTDEA